MSNWSTIYNQILTIVEHASYGESIVIKTFYSHIGRVIGLRQDAPLDEKDEVEKIFALVDKKNLSLAVYEIDKLCSATITLDAERMSAKARKMMNDGARVVEI